MSGRAAGGATDGQAEPTTGPTSADRDQRWFPLPTGSMAGAGARIRRVSAHAGDRATLAAYRAGWRGVRLLPERSAYRLFERIADVAYGRNGGSVQRMRSNYARIRPELGPAALEDLVRAGMRSYFRYWCEAFRLPDQAEADIVARVRAVDDGPLRELLAAKAPTVMVLAHLGNWDLGAAWSTTHLAPITTVAERLKPEELFQEFLHFRERLGIRILPLTSGSAVFRDLLAAIRGGEFVCLLADRDLTENGVEVDLCGHGARFAAGPAALAVSTGAVLKPVSVVYEREPQGRGGPPWGIVVAFHDPIPVPATGTTREKVAAMTQGVADGLGPVIRSHTEDWHMMQRVFVADLDDRDRHRS